MTVVPTNENCAAGKLRVKGTKGVGTMTTADHLPGKAPEQPPTPQQQPAPQPPTQVVYVPQTEKNGLGTSSFVLGLLGSLFGLIPILTFVAFPLSLLGLGLGLGNIGRLRTRKATNKVMTGIGIGLSVLGIVLSIIGMVVVNDALSNL